MNLKFYQQKGFKATLCAAIILIAIPIVTDVYKESFVSETGHFKIMGGLSIILAIGLLAKWKFVRHIAGILTGFILFATIFMAFAMGLNYAMAYTALFITLIVLLVLLNSKSVTVYMNSK
ncbi:hypothetical protein GQR60_09980 [Labilibaculum sp. A4]|uniref:hypothetical protein n=1 Tax=Labilibaculum euxinus TaxID=2686357 RepID=UPI000F627B7B|nr:hypothetical protein [Labilibaculum euxinus]MDQ1771442.1 hypothetical protein [Labilibaculum euxinus]MWN76670.1 hypothetical protein [Labilibaculum euxinus]